MPLRLRYGRRGGPSKSVLQRLATKFETIGLVNSLTSKKRKFSMQENPEQSIARRPQELDQTSIVCLSVPS